ncbi:hypothetical protein PHSC3_000898 [Chlamydiales bacterium STE3]|nr:hypothetical protein PHSC3_000898 [Chlamydiales bacterium STE3]
MQIEFNPTTVGPAIGPIIKIQSIWRGYQVRRHYLNAKNYHLAKQFITQSIACGSLDQLPRATKGITPVYIPPNLPIIFKALGNERSIRRFFAMWQARDLCLKNGYQTLLIPKAKPYAQFNIEEKFPIVDVKQREQIALYEDNKKSFVLAVREFTGFLCQSILPDILAPIHPYQSTDGNIPLIRCDNLPLMIENGIGKIALIDLGGYRLRDTPLTFEDALEAAKTAIYLFPYHFDEILEEIKKFCPEIDQQITTLQNIQVTTQKQFENIYTRHYKFLTIKKARLDADSIEKYQQEKHRFSNLEERVLKLIFVAKSKSDHWLTSDSELSIEVTCSRQLTINWHQLDKNCEESSCRYLPSFFKRLIDDRVICYANLYHNRVNELLIRIHY